MSSALSALLRAHLAFAFGATLLFWVAALSPKGGPFHRRAGRWFARAVYATAATGALMAAVVLTFHIDPAGTSPAAVAAERQTMWFVFYVLLVIVVPVQHGLAVVAAGPAPGRVRSPLHAVLTLSAIVGTFALLPASLLWGRWHFLLVVPVGALLGLRHLAYASRRGTLPPAVWQREHLTSMLTAGIALHTALSVFGTSRTLGWHPAGAISLLPWLGPAAVGLPALWWFRRHPPINPRQSPVPER